MSVVKNHGVYAARSHRIAVGSHPARVAVVKNPGAYAARSHRNAVGSHPARVAVVKNPGAYAAGLTTAKASPRLDETGIAPLTLFHGVRRGECVPIAARHTVGRGTGKTFRGSNDRDCDRPR